MSRLVISGLLTAMALGAPASAQAPPGTPPYGGGKIVGAIGCSGGAGSQDLQTCMAGVDALK
jgi:uncharacterized protein GlcG (DUF336 family)